MKFASRCDSHGLGGPRICWSLGVLKGGQQRLQGLAASPSAAVWLAAAQAPPGCADDLLPQQPLAWKVRVVLVATWLASRPCAALCGSHQQRYRLGRARR